MIYLCIIRERMKSSEEHASSVECNVLQQSYSFMYFVFFRNDDQLSDVPSWCKRLSLPFRSCLSVWLQLHACGTSI